MNDVLTTHPHYLFVYGTLKRPWGNNGLLVKHKSRFIGEACTMENFVLTAGFPFVWQPGEALHKVYKPYLGRIVGELYKLTHAGLEAVDRLEGHPSYYRRTPTTVEIGPEEKPMRFTAGIYLRPQPIAPEELATPQNGFLEWGVERLPLLEPLHPQFKRKER